MIARILLVCSCTLLASPAWAESYSWDFRNGHFDNLSLVPIGAGAVNMLRPTPEGLHITAPAGYDVKTVGFSPRFKISGDFEIDIEFTILNRTPPKAGYGTGPSIYLSMGSTKDAAASLGRQLRPDGRDIYGVFAARVEGGNRIPTAKLIAVPATSSKSGRLIMKRTDADITYSVIDASAADPRMLATLEVSDSDVTLLRVSLAQSDKQSGAEMVMHKIRIEADELPQLPSEQSLTAQLYRPRYQPPPAPQSYRWLWQAVAGLFVTGALACWLRNRRR